MNTNQTDNQHTADRLMRQLMQGTAEKPSSQLLGNIMLRIMREKRVTLPVLNKSKAVIGWMIGGLCLYMFMAVSLLYLLFYKADNLVDNIAFLKEITPVLIAVGGGAAIFYFFTQLDLWLRWEKGH